jgi:hypothetical protein
VKNPFLTFLHVSLGREKNKNTCQDSCLRSRSRKPPDLRPDLTCVFPGTPDLRPDLTGVLVSPTYLQVRSRSQVQVSGDDSSGTLKIVTSYQVYDSKEESKKKKIKVFYPPTILCFP